MTTEALRNDELLRIRGLQKTFHSRRYTTHALADIDITVQHGEIAVLLGASGCGKTTLLRCVAGLDIPDTGEIRIGGRVVYAGSRRSAVRPEDRHISMVFQSYALFPHMTAFSNVAYPLASRHVRRAQIRPRVMAALEMVGLGHRASAFPGQLSGGQQQRVALARAIVSRDELILFDEPLSNVDAQVREGLRLDLLRLHDELNFTALYVTHDQIEAVSVAHKVIVMDAGHIVQIGTPRDVYDHPASAHVAAFTGAANRITGTVIERRGVECALETPVGRLTGVLPALAPEEISVGRPAIAYFRPEHVNLSTHAQDLPFNRIAGRYGREIFLAAQISWQIETDAGQSIIGKSATSPEFNLGDEVVAHVNPQQVHVYAGQAEQ